jgi:type IV pilus assembly protein PilP
VSTSPSSTKTKNVATKNVATKKVSKKAAPSVAKQEEKKEAEFAYVTEGRRDPFVPLSQIKKPLPGVDDEPATPLQSYDIAQFRLVGVIVGKGEPKAIVVAPDGKSYILARGVKIGKNNGVVIDINSETILVEEKYYDFSDNVIENIQVITVPKREGA